MRQIPADPSSLRSENHGQYATTRASRARFCCRSAYDLNVRVCACVQRDPSHNCSVRSPACRLLDPLARPEGVSVMGDRWRWCLHLSLSCMPRISVLLASGCGISLPKSDAKEISVDPEQVKDSLRVIFPRPDRRGTRGLFRKARLESHACAASRAQRYPGVLQKGSARSCGSSNGTRT